LTEDLKPFQNYIKAIEKKLARGDTTEHTHRSAIETLFEGLDTGIIATNEPKHIECGAPDFILRKGSATVGYIEAKDIGKSLDEVEKSEQLKRYRDSLSNLILTDYLEFRWYVDGEHRLSACLGTSTKEGQIKRDKDGIQAIAELLNNFLAHRAESVGTPRELAQRMARQAHLIRNLIINAFEKEPEKGSLHSQLAAFRENLIPDLSVEYFADMYAQTIVYGLFAARCTAPDNKDFTRRNAAYLLPKTNPFLRKLFNQIAGPELDDRIAWLVDDLSQLLAQADMEGILKDFGRRSGKEDPVVHFYETFLKAYDPKIREMRGVYYTPEPVVSYIVRSIDYVLKTNFNKPQGLADEKTLILDPAVGTATFLYKVISEIYQDSADKGQQGTWNNYVEEKLLPRIFGFELLMAPYAVAHLKLGLLLQETGYEFKSEQRLGIYLTNTLEEAFKHAETFFAQWISEEANAAARVKKEEPIMVVLGNPPYSGISANASVKIVVDPKTWKTRKELTWIGRLIEDYKVIDGKPLGERKHWLQDDYVKFIRFGQWRIERTGKGILGFITNHSYLDNPTFRGMRQSLMRTFTDIYIVNLHGNTKKKEVSPDGGKDDNVFDIQQGVAIGIFIKEPNKEGPAKIHYSDMWGTRDVKYQALSETEINTTGWMELNPTSPFYFFVPREEELRPEYEKGWKVTDIFPVNSVGFVTARDSFAIDFDKDTLRERIIEFRGTSLSDSEMKDKFKLKDTSSWNLDHGRQAVRADKEWEVKFTTCLYRPFDLRHIYFSGDLLERPLMKVMRHIQAGDNIALITSRMTKGETYQHTLVSKTISEVILLSPKTSNNAFVFPLYLYPTAGEMQLGGSHRRPNLKPEFIKAVSEKLRLEFVEDGKGDMERTFGPEDIIHYAYAIFHSSTYRTRYAEFLKIDFPRLPLTADKELFKALAGKGTELVALHLIESPLLNKLITRYPIDGSNTVEKVSYDDSSQRVYINKTQYFEGVPLEVWNFHIGGYQVAHKWLKVRKGRMLIYDDLNHYQKVIVALKETIRLMAEIDTLIPGWPIE